MHPGGGEGRMTNEEFMYLGPEEEMVNVYERLKNTQARSIILVIQPHSQLSHQTEWRALHNDVRKRDQDVLIICSDQRIRAVARSAGFRVAESFESAPSEGPRHINHPIRSNKNGKTSKGVNKQGSYSNKISRSLQSGQQHMPSSSGKKSGMLSGSEKISRESAAFTSSTYEIEDISYDSEYDFPIETIPPTPTHHRSGEQEDSEVDPLEEDYCMTRSIREANQNSESSQLSPTVENTKTSRSKSEQSSKIPLPGEIEDDPLGHMEDIQPIALQEQRASTDLHYMDQDVLDISDVPADVYEQEVAHLAGMEEGMLPDDWSSHAPDQQVPEESDDQETPLIAPIPPRSSRMGNTMLPSLDDIEDDDALPPSSPVEDKTTRVTPSTVSKHESQEIIQYSQQSRKVNLNPTTPQSKEQVTTNKKRVVTIPPSNKKGSSNSSRKGKRNLFIVSIALGVLGVLLLAFVLFAYFGSNATVTVVVPAQVLSVPKQYVASMNPQSSQQNTIPSQILTYSATARGQGTVSGTIKQGNQVASGTVSFTNTGSIPLDIPTGTVLSTSGATPVQFVTIADVLVLPGASNSIPTPVQAQLPGENGNVASGSITIIPPDSLTRIAQNSNINNLTPGNLTVTNPDPTTGGGAANVQAVTSNDANALAATLQQQIQKEVNAWLKTAVHPGDVVGTPVPNVLTSATPLPEESFITTPAVGQPAPGGKFSGVLTAKVSVLIIPNASIQAAGKAQLTAYASHMNPPTTVATSSPIKVVVTKSTPSQDGKSLTVTVNATGYVVQQVLVQQISQQLAGKSVDQAKSYINNGQAGITGVVATNIVLFSPFLGFMPFRADQIHIVLQPGPIKGTTNG
jgi:Baseplate J-like protein